MTFFPQMIQLIKENKFEELKEQLKRRKNEFRIHDFLLDVLSNKNVEMDGESFDARRYQEEFLEGLTIFLALEKSNINELLFKKYSKILVELAFKMGGFIQLMAHVSMNQGVSLSDVEGAYKVNPEIRERLQSFINILKRNNESKAIANVAAAKAQVSNSIGYLLERHQVGKDMLQFAKSYEDVGQIEMATKIYKGIVNDFECDSVRLSSELFPEIFQVDDRLESEIEIYEVAKSNFERLIRQKLQEPKRVHIDNNVNAEKLAKVASGQSNESQTNTPASFWDKIKMVFKKN